MLKVSMTSLLTIEKSWVVDTVESYLQNPEYAANLDKKVWIDFLTDIQKIITNLHDTGKRNPEIHNTLQNNINNILQAYLPDFLNADLELSSIIHFIKYTRHRMIDRSSTKRQYRLHLLYDELEHSLIKLWSHSNNHVTKQIPFSFPMTGDTNEQFNIHSVMNAIPEMIVIIDNNGYIMMANRKAAELLHLTVNELIGRDLFALLPPEVANPRHALVQSAIQSRKFIQFEDEIRGQYYLNSIYHIRTQQKNKNFILFISGNYTDKRMLIKQQQASRQLLRAVIESIPIRVFWKDRESNYLGCNSLFARDAGYTSESDIIGKNDMDIWPELAEQYMKYDSAITKQGKSLLNMEEMRKLPDGNIDWYQKSKIPLRDIENNIIGILGTYEVITKKRETLQKLEMNEARYRSLFEDSPIPLWEEDFSQVKKQIDILKKKQVKHFNQYFINHPDLFNSILSRIKIININQAALRFSKLTTKNEIANFFKQQYTTQSIELFRNELVAFCNGQTSFKSEPNLQVIKDEYKWIIIQASLAPGYKDTWAKVFVSVIDITEQIQNELALKDSEQKYRVLFENANDAILIMDPFKIIDCNPKAYELFKLTENEAIGKIPHFDLSPEYQPDNQLSKEKGEQILTLVLKGENKVLEWTHIRSDQSTFPAELSLSRFDSGEKAYIHVLVRDITERKKAEEKIYESEKNYRNLFETMAQGVLYQNQKGEIISVNPATENILGIPHNELVGRNGFPDECKAIHGDGKFLKENDFPFKIALKTGKAVSNFVMGILNIQDQNYRWILVSSIPQFKHSQEKPDIVFTTFDDISDQIIVADELRKYADTQDILLQEVNHRVKNNLSAIISIIHKEMDRAEQEESDEFVPMLQNLEGRVNGLLTVHSLLSFSKWQPIKLNELCEKIVFNSLHGVSWNKKTKVIISNSQVRVNSRIAQNISIVINELTTNTLKYSTLHRDETKIRILIRNLSNKIKLIYKDDGPGFPQAILDGKIPSKCIGFGLINGIVTHSLNGQISIYNNNGAIVEILIPNKKSE